LEDIHIGTLCALLVLLIGCSAFFSGSETGLMTLNRYRLRHKAKSGDKAAQRAIKLLQRPDRLIGIILLGNNFVKSFCSAITLSTFWPHRWLPSSPFTSWVKPASWPPPSS